MKKLVAILALSATVVGVQAQNIIYDNTTTLLGSLIIGANRDWGDGVTLAGTDRVVTDLSLMIHANGGNAVASVQVRIFDGGDGAVDPGVMLWDGGLMPAFAIAAGSNMYSFAVPNVTVGNDLTWTLQLTNVVPGTPGAAVGSRFVSPATVGSSDPTNIWDHDGGVWTRHNFQPGLDSDFGATISAVPEPASMLALGAGLAALVARRRRRKA